MVNEAVWTNWGGTATCRPAEVEHPSSEEEIFGALKRAAAAGERVKVAGAGHSFTDIACTGGRMLKLDAYNRVLEVDSDARTVTVEAGITIFKLAEELAKHGLAFENLGDIGYQSLAGAISTATHGTGIGLGNLATQVKGIRLALADGSAVDLSAEHDTFKAAQVSLGGLGVISTITLQCVPAFTLHAIEEPQRLDDVLDRLPELTGATDHFEVMHWFPHTDVCVTKALRRTDEPPRPKGVARAWFEDRFLANTAIGAALRIGRARPSLLPRIWRLAGRLASRTEYSDRSDRVFTSPRLVRFSEMEYAIPRDVVAEAVRRVRTMIDEKGFRISIPIEIRFVAADDIFLSPSYGRPTAYVAVHIFERMEYEPYFREVEAIMRDYGGRPHWGKLHYQDHRTLRDLYPAWGRFAAVRSRLDPHGRFRNAYLDRVLGEI